MSHPLLAQLRERRRGRARRAPAAPSRAIPPARCSPKRWSPRSATPTSASRAPPAKRWSRSARAGSGDGVVPLLRARAARRRAARAASSAALTLARLEPPEPSLLPALVAGARRRAEGDLRWAAARVLVDMGRAARRDRARAARPGARRRRARRAPDGDLLPARARARSSRQPRRRCSKRRATATPSVRRAALTAMAGLLDPPARGASRG